MVFSMYDRDGYRFAKLNKGLKALKMLYYSFVIVIKISGEFYTVAAVWDPSVLEIDPGR